MKEMQKIRERLAAFKARSAWVKGVKEIAGGLLDKYEEIVRDREGSDPVPPRESWMDVQVRAHVQAWALIKSCMR